MATGSRSGSAFVHREFEDRRGLPLVLKSYDYLPTNISARWTWGNHTLSLDIVNPRHRDFAQFRFRAKRHFIRARVSHRDKYFTARTGHIHVTIYFPSQPCSAIISLLYRIMLQCYAKYVDVTYHCCASDTRDSVYSTWRVCSVRASFVSRGRLVADCRMHTRVSRRYSVFISGAARSREEGQRFPARVGRTAIISENPVCFRNESGAAVSSERCCMSRYQNEFISGAYPLTFGNIVQVNIPIYLSTADRYPINTWCWGSSFRSSIRDQIRQGKFHEIRTLHYDNGRHRCFLAFRTLIEGAVRNICKRQLHSNRDSWSVRESTAVC